MWLPQLVRHQPVGCECEPEIRVALGLRAARGPSVATLHRAFRRLDHAAFERVLSQWFAAQGLEPEEALAIDGKTLRGIHGEEIAGVHLVAAYAHQTRVVLAEALSLTLFDQGGGMSLS